MLNLVHGNCLSRDSSGKPHTMPTSNIQSSMLITHQAQDHRPGQATRHHTSHCVRSPPLLPPYTLHTSAPRNMARPRMLLHRVSVRPARLIRPRLRRLLRPHQHEIAETLHTSPLRNRRPAVRRRRGDKPQPLRPPKLSDDPETEESIPGCALLRAIGEQGLVCEIRNRWETSYGAGLVGEQRRCTRGTGQERIRKLK
jgi:hypothetical protein